MVARPEGEQAGGERGILFREILKIPVLMVKTNPNHVKRIGGEAHFAIGGGKSDILNFTRFLTEPLRNFVYAPGEPTNFSTLPNSTESRQFSQSGLELIYSVSRSLPPQCCGGLSATTV